MSAHDTDQELVTIRVPKRAAELLNANLEIGTSPNALRAQLICLCAIPSLFFVFGVVLVASAVMRADDIGVNRIFDVCLGTAFCVFATLFIAGVLAYRRQYKRRGLI